VVFAGEMVRWEASFGGMGQQETIKIMSISNGQDLDNYVARGAPFGYTLDQASTSENTLAVSLRPAKVLRLSAMAKHSKWAPG